MKQMASSSANSGTTPKARIRTLVLPGGRIEVSSPGLNEGEAVDVEIHSANVASPGDEGRRRVLEMIRSLPPSTRTPEEWDAYDRAFQAERDSWD
jgi:hypothetical protein